MSSSRVAAIRRRSFSPTTMEWRLKFWAGRTVKPGVNQRWICHLAFWVDDVAAKRVELERMGIVFETETSVDNDELKTAFFKDPGGNRCQIVWRKCRLGE